MSRAPAASCVLQGATLGALVVIGCGSDPGSTDAAAGDSAATEAAVTRDADDAPDVLPPSTVTVEGSYFGFFQAETTPVEGALACFVTGGDPLCGTSNASGSWRIEGVPALSDLELHLTADGYYPVWRPIHVPARFLSLQGLAYASEDFVGYLERAAGVEIDRRLGTVTFEAMQGTTAGFWQRNVDEVVATLRSVAPGGETRRASYVNEEQIPLSTLSATTRAGWGYFPNVQPGEYVVVATHPTRSCTAHPVLGWEPTDASNATVRVPVHAGAVAYATVLCR